MGFFTLSRCLAVALLLSVVAGAGEARGQAGPTFGTPSPFDLTYTPENIVYRYDLPEATGGKGELTYALSPTPPLPLGVAFDAERLAIRPSRTVNFPVALERTQYTLIATDEDGSQATWNFHITVLDTQPAFGILTPIDWKTIRDKSPRDYGESDYIELPEAIGGNGRITYTISPSLPGCCSDGFSVSSERSIRFRASSSLEAQPRTEYTLMATDTDGDTATWTFHLEIEDNSVPDFGTASEIDMTFASGTEVYLQLPEPTGGNNPFTYSITPSALPPGLSFNTFTRTISGTPVNGWEKTLYTMTATDRDGDMDTYSFYIAVEGSPVFEMPAEIDETLVVGIPMEDLQLPKAAGGPETLVYTTTDLPSGLSFDPVTHTISGTPTVAQERTRYALTATDGIDTATYYFHIAVEILTFASPPVIDKTFIVNTEIRAFHLPTATGGTGTLTYTTTDLPSGLSFNPASHRIVGIPATVQERARYTLMATDGINTATYDFHIIIEGVAFNQPSVIDKLFIANKEITSFQLPEAAGGTEALTYTTISLPTGLIFDPVTRTISGVPTITQPRTLYTLNATDGVNTATYDFHIAIEDEHTRLTFGSIATVDWTPTPENIDNGLLLPEAAGGIGRLTYELNPSLPYGLRFDTERHAIVKTRFPDFPVALAKTAYVLRATDEEGYQVTWIFHLTVEDMEPTFEFSPVDEILTKGSRQCITLPRAIDNGGTHVRISPSLPSGFSLNRPTPVALIQVYCGTPAVVQPRTRYVLTATDEDGDTGTFYFHLTVEEDTVPDFNTVGAIDMTFASGTDVSFQLPEANNGNGRLVYTITSGALPTGLRFNTFTRTISGIPSGRWERTLYTVTVADRDGDIDTYDFHLTVEGPSFGSPETIDRTLVTNTAIAPVIQLPEAVGTGTLTYTTTPLPTGLSFDPVTRRISGAPTTEQARTLHTLTATDGNRAKAFYHFYITVESIVFESPFPETDKTLIANTSVEPFELPEAFSSIGSVTYSITPRLPNGLNFDQSTRRVSGFPTTVQPRLTYTLMATDGTNSVTYDFHITVRGLFFDSPPEIDATLVSNSEIDPALQLPSAEGGAGTLTYAISPFSPLPSGLSFDEKTLRISGTPTAAQGRNPYVMTVEDGSGNMATYTFHITIQSLSFISPPEIDVIYIAGSEIDPVLQLPAATGGGTLTYTTTGLPSGLSFDENSRIVSGTPTTAQGRTAYTLTATDGGNVATYTFHITVETDEQPAFVPWPEIDETFLVGVEITPFELPSASGGNGGVIYSTTLPDGLSFNTGTRMVSGIPTTAQPRTEHTLTATDGDRDMATFSFHITVNPNTPPDFDSASAISKTYSQSDTADLQLPEAEDGNGAFTYELIPPLSAGLSFDSVRRIVAIDYGFANFPEAQAETTYTLIARDGDEDTGAGDTGTFTFDITVEDIAPDFGSQTVDEELILGRYDRVNLPEATGNGKITYTVTPSLTGGLSFNRFRHRIEGTPDTVRERTTYTLTAIDRDGDTAILTFALAVVDTVGPPPEIPQLTVSPGTPAATESSNLTFSLVLSPASTGTVTVAYTLTDDTATHGADYTVSAPSTATSGMLTFDPGETSQMVVLSLIDDNEDETDETVTLTLSNLSSTAGFPGGATSVTSVGTIRDNDGNTRPVFVSSSPIDETLFVHKEAGGFQLPFATGGDGALTYSITGGLSAGLNFDPATRMISGTPTAEQGRTEYSLTVGDSDGDTSAGDTDTFTFHITVEPNTVPDFGSPGAIIHTFTPGNIGAGLSLPTVPPVTGGDGNLTYGVTPSLSSGLIFDDGQHAIVHDSAFVSFPLMLGDQTYTLTATDEDGDTATFPFITIAVEDIEPDFGLQTVDEELVRGSHGSINLPLATGGNGRIGYEVTPALPSGLFYFPSFHRIDGTPDTAQGRTTYTLTARDRDGDTDQMTFNLAVVSPQLTVSPGTPTVAEDGGTLTFHLSFSPPTTETVTVDYTLTGGTATHGMDYTVAVPSTATSGTLTFAPGETSQTVVLSVIDDTEDEPDETVMLTLNNLSSSAVFPGEVSGIISAVEIVDNDTNTAPVFVSRPVIEKTLVFNTDTGLPFPLPKAEGGNGGVSYTITPGLPAGLAFDSDTRAIIGVPTALQVPTEYTLTAGDSDMDTSAEDTDTYTFTITVEEDRQPAFAEETLEVTFVRGNYKLVPLPTVEGNGDIGYAIDPSLPSGVNLSALNVLHGTPDAAQSRSEYTITARDIDGDTDTMTLYITISETPLLTVSASSPTIAEHGGTLTFSIALDSAAPETVTVDYALTGTAQPGPDYTIDAPLTSAAGVLVFSPGSALQQTIELSIVDDKTHEKDETVVLTLGGLTVAEFPGGAGTITSVVTITDNDEDPNAFIREVNTQVLPKIAMTIASETAGAIRDRIKEAFSGVSSGVYVRGGGWRQFLAAEASRDNERAEMPDIKLSDLSFVLAADEWGDSDYDYGGGSVGFRAWGRGYYHDVDFGGDIIFDGGITGGMVGVDTIIMSNLLTGVSANLFNADINFSRSGLTPRAHETTAWSVHPYVGWRPLARTTVWGTAGYGMGDIKVEGGEGDCASENNCHNSDINLLTLGGGGNVLIGNVKFGSGRVSLDMLGDVALARISEGGSGGLELDAGVARFGIELGYGRPLGLSGNLGGDIGLSYRADFGDIKSGSGLEAGGGLNITIPGAGLRFEGNGRALLSGVSSVDEWGFSGDIIWSYNSDNGTGPYIIFRPEWGATNDRRDDLWERGVAELGVTEDSGGQRYVMEAGYGVALMGDSGIMTFFARNEMEGGEAASQSGGLDIEMTGGLSVGYETVSRTSEQPEHRGYLRYAGKF